MMEMDSNHDGKISRVEFTAGMQARMAKQGGDGPPGGAGSLFQRDDRDGDGFITRAELDQQTAQRFARLDAGHAGFISVDQLHRPAPAAAKPRRHKPPAAAKADSAAD